MEVVCIGESMATLVPEQPGPLEHVTHFRRGVGGAESNVASGLAALGVSAAWLSRVGDDGFGRALLTELTGRGVDTSAVEVDPLRATGLYVKEIGGHAGMPHDLGAGISRLHYYRTGSAASALGPESLETPAARALLDAARIVHVSGITAAMGRLGGYDGGRRLVESLLDQRRPGQLISFDLNWRPRVWQSPAAAQPMDVDSPTAILADLASRADIVFLGTDEAADVFGTEDPAHLRAALRGPRFLVVKDGSRGATGFDGDEAVAEPALNVEVVEPIGAGDAFAAGYLAGLLEGRDQQQRLRLGHICAATALMVSGDHCTPPDAVTLRALLNCSPSQWSAVRASGGVFSLPDGIRAAPAVPAVPAVPATATEAAR